MKKLTYLGNQSSITLGKLVLAKGKTVELSDDDFNSIKKHQVIAALIKSGELQVEEVSEVSEKTTDTAAINYAKLTVEQLKASLEEKNIFFEADAKKADLIALLKQAD